MPSTASSDTISPPWEARARAWAALAFGLAAVLGTAYYFFVVQVDARQRALETLSAQGVAHRARQAERKLEAYRKIAETALHVVADAKSDAKLSEQVGHSLLPSYGALLSECNSPGEQSSRLLCIANKIASVTAPATLGNGFRFEQSCPKDAQVEEVARTVFDGERSLLLLQKGRSVCGKLALASLFQNPAPTSMASPRDQLDGLLVLDEQGTVVWQEPGSRLRVRSLHNLLGSDGKPRELNSSLMVSGLALGTSRYKAFVEPLDVASLGQGKGKLVLCGLVDEARLREQSQRIDPISFLWAGLLLVLGVLSFPMAKLWLLAPRSRFHRSDARLLLASGAATVLVAVTVFMGFVVRNRLSAHLDRQLLSRAEQVKEQLDARVRSNTRSLDGLTSSLRLAEPKPDVPCAPCEKLPMTDATFGTDTRSYAVCECTGTTRDGLHASSGEGAPFRRAFWANLDGYQLVKLAPGPHATPPICVASRAYFRRAKELGSLWNPETGEPLPAVVEIVRSNTSGKMVLIAARATLDRQSAQVNGVLGVEASLDELAHPVLPLGFELAVVNDAGKVVLHSDNESHQGQSIFDEIEELTDLRTLERPTASLVSYLGTPSRVHAVATKSGFLLLMIAPQSLVDRPAQSMTLATLMLCAMLLLAGVLLGLLARFVRMSLRADSKSHPRLASFLLLLAFRPVPQLAVRYTALGVATTIGALLTCLMVFAFRPEPLLTGVIGLSVSALVYLALKRSTLQLSLARSYAVYCFGLGAFLLVLPAVGGFVESYHHFTEASALREAGYVMRTLEHRASCFRSPCPDVYTLSLTDDEPTPPERTGNAYAASFVPGSAAVDLSIRWLMARVFEQFPDLSEPPPRRSESFQLRYRDGLPVVRPRSPDARGQSHHFEVPVLASRDYSMLNLSLLALAFVALGLTSFILWTRSVARLFFLDALTHHRHPPVAADTLHQMIDEGASSGSHAQGRILYVYPPPTLLAELAADPTFRAWPADDGEQAGQVLLVADLTPLLTDERALLRFEARGQNAERLLICSRLDPLLAALGPLRTRWLAVLARCHWIVGNHYQKLPSDSPAAMEAAWHECDVDEKRLLSQLAFDGHASPNRQNLRVVRRLVARGLLEPDTLGLAHPELGEYLRNVSSTAELRSQEAMDGGTPWNMLKVPIATAVLVLLAGVSYGQPDAVTSAVAVPGLALSVPMILRALISVASARLGSSEKAG